jgi:RecB family exonuclease
MLFGLPAHWRPTTDPASVTEAIKVLSGARLRGSINLVERRADGALRVTDHKTGKARVPEGAMVWGGQPLQSVLYGLL